MCRSWGLNLRRFKQIEYSTFNSSFFKEFSVSTCGNGRNSSRAPRTISQVMKRRYSATRVGENTTMEGMKARVYVSFKSTVLDPQGQTIRNALNGLGHKTVADVRQGKFFDIELAPGSGKAEAEREMKQIAHDVLANPVIEDYRVEILE